MDLELMLDLKEDVVGNKESIRYDFGKDVSEGCEGYLMDFFAYNSNKYDDSQENFDLHIDYVRQLFKDYIY